MQQYPAVVASTAATPLVRPEDIPPQIVNAFGVGFLVFLVVAGTGAIFTYRILRWVWRKTR